MLSRSCSKRSCCFFKNGSLISTAFFFGAASIVVPWLLGLFARPVLFVGAGFAGVFAAGLVLALCFGSDFAGFLAAGALRAEGFLSFFDVAIGLWGEQIKYEPPGNFEGRNLAALFWPRKGKTKIFPAP